MEARKIDQSQIPESPKLVGPVEAKFNHLTGKELAPGEVVGRSVGGQAQFNSLTGESFRFRKVYVTLVKAEGEGQNRMYVMPAEATQIQAADSRWKLDRTDQV